MSDSLSERRKQELEVAKFQLALDEEKFKNDFFGPRSEVPAGGPGRRGKPITREQHLESKHASINAQLPPNDDENLYEKHAREMAPGPGRHVSSGNNPEGRHAKGEPDQDWYDTNGEWWYAQDRNDQPTGSFSQEISPQFDGGDAGNIAN